MVQEANWMVHHLSEEVAQLILQETIDPHPVHPHHIHTCIHICLHIHMLSHAADLLEEQV
jgi:hypothetical protein